jgi:predicted RNase H-like HicB family nuclease
MASIVEIPFCMAEGGTPEEAKQEARVALSDLMTEFPEIPLYPRLASLEVVELLP